MLVEIIVRINMFLNRCSVSWFSVRLVRPLNWLCDFNSLLETCIGFFMTNWSMLYKLSLVFWLCSFYDCSVYYDGNVMVNISLCIKIELMFRHKSLKVMILTFYAHVYVFDADDELWLHKKGCKYKLLTEGSTRFQ
jgi:hypothetical protein